MDKADSFWYVARTGSCMEKRMAAILEGMGVTFYLPVQVDEKQYKDRKKKVEKLVIPRVVFVCSTELMRRQLLRDIPNFIFPSCMCRDCRPLRIPQVQIEQFRQMVEGGFSDEVVPITREQFVAGQTVRIIDGPFKDRMVQISQVDGKHCMAVNLDGLGAFAMTIPTEYLSAE